MAAIDHTRDTSLKIAQAAEPRGLGELPVCMGKTPPSLSHDPALRNAIDIDDNGRTVGIW